MLKTHRHFFLGDWQVSRSSNTLRQGDAVKQLEPKAMDVLWVLCQQQGQVLSADDIIDQCWGNADVGDNPVHKAINQLRKAFDDKPSQPTYIETIRKRGYRIIAELKFPLDDEIKAQQTVWQGDSPFPGLSAFEPDDAQVFFGRNEQIHTLLERISKQVTYGRAFCLILGPSGSGKSSLVNAGLLPRLLDSNGFDGIGVVSYSSLDFADIAQQRLFIDLASAMLDWDIQGQPIFDGMSADSLADLLQNDCAQIITLCKQALAQAHFAKPHFFLFIDRLEVLLSSPLFSEDERSPFLTSIEALATSGCIMVFSACRNDFYPLVVNHPSLMAGKANGAHFDLLNPHRSELMQMIRLPAIAANLSWSKDPDTAMPLDEILCAEAASNPDSLPMLQYTLQELYLQRSSDNELQFAVYQALGGIEGAIGKKAEELYLQLPEQQQAQLAFVLSLVVTLNPDGETITSRAARWSQLSKPAQTAFVQAMVDSRLFVSHLQNNEPCFSLAHEALLRRWPRASQWISEHQDSLEVKSRLQQLSERWVNEGKSSAYLLAEGKPLQEALSLQHSSTFTLDNNEKALILSSLKRAKTKRWSTGVAILLLCILSFTSVLMSIQSQESQNIAEQKRLEAESLLGFMVGEFADKLRSVKRMDLLDGISNKALEYFSQQDNEPTTSLLSFANKDQNFKAQYQHAQTLGAMGEVAYSRGKNDEAQQAFASAKLILERLYKTQPDNLDLLKTLGANAFWLGQLKYDENDLDSAEPLFKLYRDYSEQMNKLEPENVDSWIELSYSHNSLGSLYLKQNNYLSAKNNFAVSLQLKNQAIQSAPKDLNLLIDKVDTLSWMATTEQNLGNLTNALIFLQQGQDELERAQKDNPANANLMDMLALSYIHQSKILDFQQNYIDAFTKTKLAIEKYQVVLQQDPGNEIWQSILYNSQVSLVLLWSKISEDPSNQLDIELNLDLPDIPYLLANQPKVLIDIIQYHQQRQNWGKSQQLINMVSTQMHNLTNLKLVTSKFAIAQAEFFLVEAKQLANSNLIKKKLINCQKAISTLNPFILVSKNPEYLLPYVQAHYCINQVNAITAEIETLKTMHINNIRF